MYRNGEMGQGDEVDPDGIPQAASAARGRGMTRKRQKPPGTRGGAGMVTGSSPAASAASAKKGPARTWRSAAVGLLVAAVLGAGAFAAYQWNASLARGGAEQAAAVASVPPVAAPEYVGRTACAECHAKQTDAWRGSDHDLAMQDAGEKSVLGDFANAKFSYAGTTSTFSRRDGKYYVRTDGPDGKLADYEIKYTFGVHPLQQYLVEFPGGRMQALSIAWDSRPKVLGGQRWFHLYPGQNVKAGDFLHWTSPGQNWNFTCAECHSTNLRKNYDATADTFKTTWSELNVSCEACHGAGSNHVRWARKEGDWQSLAATRGLALALDERKGVTWQPQPDGNSKRSVPRSSSREIDTCTICHGRAARISDDDVHGRPLLDTHRLALLDDNLYWNDGQMRDEVYNWGSFAQSRMHAEGVTCSDCHDPHSLKLRAPGNDVCAQCHRAATFDVAAHTHHAAGTAGAACAACHMPTTTYMVVDPRHDHSMRIPRPDLSARLGTPNACNNCHTREKPQWAAAAIARWNGGKVPVGYQQFADALRAGSEGAPGARGALLTLVDDKAQPAIVRASAIDRLGHWMTPATLPAVSRALNDPDAVVRLAAVEALAATDPPTRQRYLPRMLTDPVRAVRIEAARALAGPSESGLPPADRAAFERALAEFVAVEKYNGDRPEGRARLADLYATRGNAEGAIAEYRKAIAIDPTYLPAYANLADLYRARGADGDAEALLRQGIAKVPAGAALHHTLGLVLVRQKRGGDALKELAEADRLDPANARFAYVYAVALNDAGQTKQAQKVLDDLLKRHPYDRDTLAALAFFRAKAGDRDAAQGYVRQLRELDPESTEYAQMAKQFEGTAGGAPRR